MAYLGFVWDETGDHLYETGVDHMIMANYNADTKKYDVPVVWNGIVSITESPSGAESNKVYADNIEYLNLFSKEEYGSTIEAYTYPSQFEVCNGSKAIFTGVLVGQQQREMFAFAYRTRVGNDVKGDKYGYKLHLVWGAKVSPSDKQYSTVNDSPEAMTLSWDVTTTPINFTYDDVEYSVAHMEIDAQTADADSLAELEERLFGSEEVAVTQEFPMPSEVLAYFESDTPDPDPSGP